MPLQLLKGIRHFKNNQLKEEKDLFASLGKGQSPDVLFLTCSDSRLSPHQFTHSGLGALFMGRNPGNIVPPYPDTAIPSGEASTIEYALTALTCKEIIVCGHSHCGAMKGLLTPDLEKDLPHTAAWLRHSTVLVEHLEKRHPELAKDPASKLKHLTQDNVLLQMEHLQTHPAVAKRLAAGTLKIHGWYYEIETGEVYIYTPHKKAFVSFEQTVEEVATEKLIQVVELEARKYLASLTNPKNIKGHLSLVENYRKVRFTGVSAIWDHIETEVKTQLKHQIGELYATDDGGISPLFDALIKKGPAIRLGSHILDPIQQAITASTFHKATLSSHGTLFSDSTTVASKPDKVQSHLVQEIDTGVTAHKTAEHEGLHIRKKIEELRTKIHTTNWQIGVIRGLFSTGIGGDVRTINGQQKKLPHHVALMLDYLDKLLLSKNTLSSEQIVHITKLAETALAKTSFGRAQPTRNFYNDAIKLFRAPDSDNSKVLGSPVFNTLGSATCCAKDDVQLKARL